MCNQLLAGTVCGYSSLWHSQQCHQNVIHVAQQQDKLLALPLQPGPLTSSTPIMSLLRCSTLRPATRLYMMSMRSMMAITSSMYAWTWRWQTAPQAPGRELAALLAASGRSRISLQAKLAR